MVNHPFNWKIYIVQIPLYLTLLLSLAFGEVKSPIDGWLNKDQIQQNCDSAIEAALTAKKELIRSSSKNIKVLLKLHQTIYENVDLPYGISGLLFNVHPVKEIRDAAELCEKRIAKLINDLNLDRSIYDAMQRMDKHSIQSASTDDQRAQALIIRDFKRAGVFLDQKQRSRLSVINNQLTELSQQFSKNVSQDVKKVQFKDRQVLRGLPDDYVKAHVPNAEGMITITTDYPDFFPFQKYSQDRNARAQLYRAFLQRGYPKNKQLLLDVLTLRQEYAEILGYANWADYNAADKMVQTAKQIESFINKLKTIV